MEILISNRQNTKTISDKEINLIKEGIYFSLKEENIEDEVEISLSFVEDEEIQNLNKTYRGKDHPTDVLSFPLGDKIDNVLILGDIVISVERAISQACEYNHNFERELIYLIIHGMFHLMGYDHLNDEEKIIMRKKEKSVIKKLKLFKN